MITFAVESMHDCWNDCLDLARQHWQETEAYHSEQQTFNPSFDRYLRYHSAGMFFLATARDGPTLVGYAGFYVMESMHSQRTVAVEDTVFLTPAYRKGRTGIRFVQFLEEECWARGALEITMTAKMSNVAASRILQYLKYEPTAMQYTKQRPVAVLNAETEMSHYD